MVLVELLTGRNTGWVVTQQQHILLALHYQHILLALHYQVHYANINIAYVGKHIECVYQQAA